MLSVAGSLYGVGWPCAPLERQALVSMNHERYSFVALTLACFVSLLIAFEWGKNLFPLTRSNLQTLLKWSEEVLYGIAFGSWLNKAIRDMHDRSSLANETDERKTCPSPFFFMEGHLVVIFAASSGLLFHNTRLLALISSKKSIVGQTISMSSRGP